MLKQFKAFEAPARYDFIDPDTQLNFQASSKDDLIKQITAYRAQNKLDPIEGLPIILDNYWCEQPVNAGKCKPCTEETITGFTQYLKGGMIMLKALLMQKFAPQEIADERGAKCAACPFNSRPDEGPFMVWIEETTVAMVGKRKCKDNDKLALCAVCNCPLRSKVFINEKLPTFSPMQVKRMKSVNCWQLELSGQQ